MHKKILSSLLLKTATLSTLLLMNLSAQDRPAVSATNVEASKPAAYIFEVDFDAEVSPNTRLNITFPNAFNISTVMMAVSEKLDGNLQAAVQANTVTLQRVGAESSVPAGEAIDLKVASVINPANMDQDWDFIFAVLNGNTEIARDTLRTRVAPITR